MTLSVAYLDEYVVEEGVQRFMLPNTYRFACTIDEPHIVETELIFQSDKKEGTFVFCPKHCDFIDVSVSPKKSGDTT